MVGAKVSLQNILVLPHTGHMPVIDSAAKIHDSYGFTQVVYKGHVMFDEQQGYASFRHFNEKLVKCSHFSIVEACCRLVQK